MKIRTRMCMSLDGYVTTPDGWPAQLDTLGLIVLPLLLGDGMRRTPSVSIDTALTFESERTLPGGAVEIAYAVTG
jgi:hypothetical protein